MKHYVTKNLKFLKIQNGAKEKIHLRKFNRHPSMKQPQRIKRRAIKK